MLYDALIAPFLEFEFMRRALVGAVALALGAAPVGVFLMLRRMSLTGDAMTHAILPGVGVGYLIAGFSVPAMTLGGLAAGFTVALLAGLLARSTSLKEDATLATFYLISLACGVILVSSRGSNIDLLHFLFGNVLAIDDAALIVIASFTSVSLVALAVIYRPLVLDTVDPGYLRSVSRAGGIAHLTFLGLVVVTLVGSFQALGSLLGVGVMILPAVAARFWANDVSKMVPLAVTFGVVANVGGLLASYHLDRETGPTIILSAGLIVVVSLVFGPSGGLIWKALPKWHRVA